MTFKKGQSGNPKGRKPGSGYTPPEVVEWRSKVSRMQDIRTLAKTFSEEAVTTLSEIMKDKAAPHSSRVAAANSLLDRGWGKPKETIEANVTLTSFEAMSIDELRDWVAAEARTIEGSLVDIEAEGVS